MRKLIQTFLSAGALLLLVGSASAFSLIGPVANGNATGNLLADTWQLQSLGFNPLAAPDPLGFTDGHPTGPKNIGEGYRRNTPVMYYTFDQNFMGFFGSNGTNAVDQAFDILNALTNVDNYSTDLSEFPLQSSTVNYQAQGLFLVDLKSYTLASLMSQLGLADAVRYTWVMHARWHVGTPVCPAGEEYLIAERNFDISSTSLSQYQYTPYVNGSLYTYSIFESCEYAQNPFPPIDGMAVPTAVDPLNDNEPVASGLGVGFLGAGQFYTGLTRDDVAGFRNLLRAGNINVESPASGALLQTPTGSSTTILPTSDLGLLLNVASITDPVTLSNEFPNLIVSSVTTNFNVIHWQTNIVTYITNLNGSAVGSPVIYTTISVTPTFLLVTNYDYTFANVVTNSYSVNSKATLETISNMPIIGAPYGTGPGLTRSNFTTITISNVPSGDYYIIPPGTCGFSILSLLGTVTNLTTNAVFSTTNSAGFTFSQILETRFVQHYYTVQEIFCGGVTPPVGQYEGIEHMQFVHVDPNQYDYQSGLFYTPITNTYTMSLYVPTNNTYVIQNFQRVLTSPDFLFSVADLTTTGGGDPSSDNTSPDFNQANILRGEAGPGTIDSTTNAVFTFNKQGVVFENDWPFDTGLSGLQDFTYGSFDGTTNTPVVYPNGTSISDIENGVFIEFSPASLPLATNGVTYSATFTVTGGQAPYTWALATGSVLPTGLTLSSGGVLSGKPTQVGTFDVVIQMTDSATSPHVVQRSYTLTIN